MQERRKGNAALTTAAHRAPGALVILICCAGLIDAFLSQTGLILGTKQP